MKRDELYTKIMNQLEIIHAENIAIMRLFLLGKGVSLKEVDDLSHRWDKRFQDERSEW